jgi:hypothetical protein
MNRRCSSFHEVSGTHHIIAWIASHVRVAATRVGAMAGIRLLPLEWSDAAGPRAGVPERFVASAESGAQADIGSFSPDGRWVTYVTAPFGLPEVFVRSYSGRGQWQISAGGKGGEGAVWSRDGRTLLPALKRRRRTQSSC